MTIWHCLVAVSLDGKIARPDGALQDWYLRDYPLEEFGLAEFLGAVDAILMGSATYAVNRGFGDWLYPGIPSYVLTSRPPDGDPPPNVHFRPGPLATVLDDIDRSGAQRGWIEGGGQIVRAMMALGRLDVLDLVVLPIILGPGIPLFPDGTPELRLRLDFTRSGPGDAVRLRYSRPATDR